MKKSGISMMAVAPHKGLHAPQGVGLLLISKGEVRPFRYGGTGHGQRQASAQRAARGTGKRDAPHARDRGA